MKGAAQTPTVPARDALNDGSMSRWRRGVPWCSAMLLTGATAALMCMYCTSGGAPVEVEEFHQAISRGHIVEVRQMIADGVDVNGVDDSDSTPLMTAATFGRPEVLQALLDAGADVHQKGRGDRTSLYCAAGAMRHSTECVRILLQRGAAADHGNVSGRTPLMLACLYGNYESAVLLLDAGADPHAIDVSGQQPLWYAACAYGNDVRLLRLLVALGCDVNRVDNQGGSPLHSAARAGRVAAVNLLVAAGADRQCQDAKGRIPLELATKYDVRTALGLTMQLAEAPLPQTTPGPPAAGEVPELKHREAAENPAKAAVAEGGARLPH